MTPAPQTMLRPPAPARHDPMRLVRVQAIRTAFACVRELVTDAEALAAVNAAERLAMRAEVGRLEQSGARQ